MYVILMYALISIPPFFGKPSRLLSLVVRALLKYETVDVTVNDILDVAHDIWKHEKVDVTRKNKAGSTVLDITDYGPPH
jgi:hypothetical protein